MSWDKMSPETRELLDRRRKEGLPPRRVHFDAPPLHLIPDDDVPAVVKPGKGRPMATVKAKARVAPEPDDRDPMNKTERAYAEHLEGLLRAGAIVRWDWEPEAFRIGDDCFYRPDFRVILPDGTIEFHEVKGFWRDDARVKWRSVAQAHPMYRFVAVQQKRKRDGGGWTVERQPDRWVGSHGGQS